MIKSYKQFVEAKDPPWYKGLKYVGAGTAYGAGMGGAAAGTAAILGGSTGAILPVAAGGALIGGGIAATRFLRKRLKQYRARSK